MIRSIVTNRDKLQQVCEPGPVADLVVADLLDTAEHWGVNRCLGLAAPQIGYPRRAFVMLFDGQFITVINPEIIKSIGSKTHKREGCLSVPGVSVRRGRYKRIQVRYTDENGDQIERRFNNKAAIIFQHEFDHLNGVIITR